MPIPARWNNAVTSTSTLLLSVVAASAELAVVAVDGVLRRQRGVFTHRARYGDIGG
jgi:hypothetical protein